MSVRYPDSCGKIMQYLHRLEAGRYNVFLSPTFFRSLICPENCGACCPKFSLDYILEKNQKNLHKFYPESYRNHFKFREYNDRLILSDMQENNPGTHCQFLDEKARCSIHLASPLSCRIELIKFRKVKDRVYIGKQFFGRAWAMTRINGEKGCLCKFEEYNEEQYQSDLKVLRDLNAIADIFEIKTVLPYALDLLEKLGSDTKLKKKIRIQIAGMERLDKWTEPKGL